MNAEICSSKIKKEEVYAVHIRTHREIMVQPLRYEEAARVTQDRARTSETRGIYQRFTALMECCVECKSIF